MNPNFQRMIDKNGYFMDIYKFLSKEGEELNPIFDFNESE